MNIWTQMEQCKGDFTPKEYEIYELVKKDPYLFSSASAVQIAQQCHVAQSAISRFCQKLGFSGFAEFRLSMVLATSKHSYNLDESSIVPQDDSYYLCDMIHQSRNAVSDETLDRLAQMILNAKTIYSAGHGSSYPAAHVLSIHLITTGKPAHVIQPEYEVETLHIMQPDDMVFLFSAANPTFQSFLSLIDDMPKELRPYTVLIANTKTHPLRHRVNETIAFPNWRSLQYPYSLNPYVAQIAFCNFLIRHLNALRSD